MQAGVRHRHLVGEAALVSILYWRCGDVVDYAIVATTYRFQFSIGDAKLAYMATKTKPKTTFQFSIGDARRETAGLLRKLYADVFQFSIEDASLASQ